MYENGSFFSKNGWLWWYGAIFMLLVLLSHVSILSACTTASIVSTTLPIYFIVSIKLKEEDTSYESLQEYARVASDLGKARPRQQSDFLFV